MQWLKVLNVRVSASTAGRATMIDVLIGIAMLDRAT